MALYIMRWANFNDLMQKLTATKPICEGSVADLKTRVMIPAELAGMIIVLQRGYAFGSPHINGSRFLATYGVESCIVVLTHNPEKQVGFLAHLDRPEDVTEALSKATLQINAKTLILFGGKLHYHRSTETLMAIKNLLDMEPQSIEVIGCDLFRGKYFAQDEDNIWRFHHHRSTSIAMDTSNGKVFMPALAQAPLFPNDLPAPYHATLSYDGSKVAPAQAFLDIARS